MSNRECFNNHIREQVEAKMKILEEMSNSELVDSSFTIKIDVVRELAYYKLDKTNALSVGTTTEVKLWLDEEEDKK